MCFERVYASLLAAGEPCRNAQLPWLGQVTAPAAATAEARSVTSVGLRFRVQSLPFRRYSWGQAEQRQEKARGTHQSTDSFTRSEEVAESWCRQLPFHFLETADVSWLTVWPKTASRAWLSPKTYPSRREYQAQANQHCSCDYLEVKTHKPGPENAMHSCVRDSILLKPASDDHPNSLGHVLASRAMYLWVFPNRDYAVGAISGRDRFKHVMRTSCRASGRGFCSWRMRVRPLDSSERGFRS